MLQGSEAEVAKTFGDDNFTGKDEILGEFRFVEVLLRHANNATC